MRIGKIGMQVSSEEVLITKDGFVLSPFPKFTKDNFSTNRKTINVVKKVDLWLVNNAYEKSLWKNDRFNQIQFKHMIDNCKKNNLSTSDKDSAEMYIFEM